MTPPIVLAARRYVGTPWVHQGRTAQGLDCIGLMIVAAQEAGHLDAMARRGRPFQEVPYQRFADGSLMRWLEYYLEPVVLGQVANGDVLAFKIRRVPQHVGMVSDVGIIHAYSDVVLTRKERLAKRRTRSETGRVVEQRLSERWSERLVAAFRFPGV